MLPDYDSFHYLLDHQPVEAVGVESWREAFAEAVSVLRAAGEVELCAGFIACQRHSGRALAAG